MEGKVALVTGGATGIGLGIARRFAQAGALVTVCGRRRSMLDELAAKSRLEGWTVNTMQADVSLESDVERLVEAVLERHGRIDILVNNAAIGGGSEIHAHSVEEWDRILSVNLRGPFLMSRYVVPIFRAQQSGHILMVSSESAMNHYPGDGAYGVSKHALNALAEYIQAENQTHGVRVDTICPGMVVTEMTEGQAGLNYERCLEPGDIADLAFWLVTRRDNIKIGTPILIQTMLNPWD
jgi:3-oxoacyl-[acyl-carrier protein] reductase